MNVVLCCFVWVFVVVFWFFVVVLELVILVVSVLGLLFVGVMLFGYSGRFVFVKKDN